MRELGRAWCVRRRRAPGPRLFNSPAGSIPTRPTGARVRVSPYRRRCAGGQTWGGTRNNVRAARVLARRPRMGFLPHPSRWSPTYYPAVSIVRARTVPSPASLSASSLPVPVVVAESCGDVPGVACGSCRLTSGSPEPGGTEFCLVE
jgi:hypothetical protein